MKYLRRKMDETLLSWKRGKGHCPLVVKGARQVGKTETIRRFGQGNYANTVEINFATQPQFRHIVADGYAVGDILRNLSRIAPTMRVQAGKTLLFFDEIQEFPDIATALKPFAEDGRFDVICSGSLLGVHYKRISHIAVGRQTEIEMQSMDFEEFLWACGHGRDLVDDALGRIVEARPLREVDSGVLAARFLDFCILGGMPAVVSRYAGQGTFEGTLAIQRQILAGYRADVRKYVEGLDQSRILKVFESIPPQLARENKKFQLSKVEKGARFRDYNGCVEWICDAGIARKCHCLSFPELPLGGNFDPDRFKLYMADSGLLVAMLDDEAQLDLRANRNLGGWKGGLYENIVAEALSKSGFPLYYWKRENSTLEEDFFVRFHDNLVPVEVKATHGRSQSLRTLIASDRYPDIRWGVKFTSGNIGFENSILTLPHSLAFLLRRALADSRFRPRTRQNIG